MWVFCVHVEGGLKGTNIQPHGSQEAIDRYSQAFDRPWIVIEPLNDDFRRRCLLAEK